MTILWQYRWVSCQMNAHLSQPPFSPSFCSPLEHLAGVHKYWPDALESKSSVHDLSLRKEEQALALYNILGINVTWLCEAFCESWEITEYKNLNVMLQTGYVHQHRVSCFRRHFEWTPVTLILLQQHDSPAPPLPPMYMSHERTLRECIPHYKCDCECGWAWCVWVVNVHLYIRSCKQVLGNIPKKKSQNKS